MFETPERKKQKGEDTLDWAAFENEERKGQMERRKKGWLKAKNQRGNWVGNESMRLKFIMGKSVSIVRNIQPCKTVELLTLPAIIMPHSRILKFDDI